MKEKLTFLDLFAGAGGLSEGFIQAGFFPVAHVETDKGACFTLKTRMAYHWLRKHGKINSYNEYLNGKFSRDELYKRVPKAKIASVINAEICKESISGIFRQIDELLGNKSLDLIVGGPPCQAYSLAGRSRDKNRMQGDKRNYLYFYYAEFLKRYKPQYFVFENVSGLFSAKSPDRHSYFDSMRELFREAGYETEYKLLLAYEYGVLQNRKRIILVGRKGSKTGFYPEPEQWKPNVKVKDIFSDLPLITAGRGTVRPCYLKDYSGEYLYDSGIRNGNVSVSWHMARPNTEQDLEIYRIAVQKWNQKRERLDYNELPYRLKTHNNRSSFIDRFKVVSADLPFSQTIVAHIAKDGHYYIHPDIRQNRSITPREAARLQTFPDDYFFESVSEEPGRTPVFSQIGNAVPVLLAKKVAEKLMEVW